MSTLTLPLQGRARIRANQPSSKETKGKIDQKVAPVLKPPQTIEEKLDLELLEILQYLQLHAADASNSELYANSKASGAIPNLAMAYFGLETIRGLKKTNHKAMIDGMSKAKDQRILDQIQDFSALIDKNKVTPSKGLFSYFSPSKIDDTLPNADRYVKSLKANTNSLKQTREANLNNYVSQANANGLNKTLWDGLRDRVTLSNSLWISSSLTSLVTGGIDYWQTQKYSQILQGNKQKILNIIQDLGNKINNANLSEQEKNNIKKQAIDQCKALINQQNHHKTGLDKNRNYLNDANVFLGQGLSAASTGITVYGLMNAMRGTDVSSTINSMSKIYDNNLFKSGIKAGLGLTAAGTSIGTILSLYGIANYAYERLFEKNNKRSSPEIDPIKKNGTIYETLSATSGILTALGTIGLSMTNCGWAINSLFTYGTPTGNASNLSRFASIVPLASGIWTLHNLATKNKNKQNKTANAMQNAKANIEQKNKQLQKMPRYIT